MTIRELINKGARELYNSGIDCGESDARLLAMYCFKMDYQGLLLEGNSAVSPLKEAEYNNLIKKRSTHFPCQYITGTQDFMGYTFMVREGVLIPRPETELLVEAALKEVKDKSKVKALDMCCGSGCIGLGFGKKRIEAGFYNDDIYLADISSHAIELSKENRDRLELGFVNIIQSDLFKNVNEKDFDIIMSNPPYISTGDLEKIMRDVRDYEPRLALDGMEDGLYFYREIIRVIGTYLTSGGVALFEIGYNQYEPVKAMLNSAGFENVILEKDYAGLDRIVIARR